VVMTYSSRTNDFVHGQFDAEPGLHGSPEKAFIVRRNHGVKRYGCLISAKQEGSVQTPQKLTPSAVRKEGSFTTLKGPQLPLRGI